MDWLTLPEPRKNIALAFNDGPTAKAWLASQPQAQPMHMLAAISLQIEAIEATPLAPPLAIELLSLLRTAAVPAQDAIESRYVRKALPMQDDDQRCFEVAQRLWLRLGTAYLRLAPQFVVPAEKYLPLYRAACAFRMAEYCHFLAAQECPQWLDQCLFAVLAQADSSGQLREAQPDPDFPHFGQATILGHLSWAFMLRLVDPYRFSAAQLAVANRAISRWRELASFQAAPGDETKEHTVDLAPLFGEAVPEGVPSWLEVRKVTRKIGQRIAALRAGELPEDLKLGRELSPTACIRLLHQLESSLEVRAQQQSTEIGEIELAFGADYAYAVFTGEMLVASGALGTGSAALAHQRVAMFGFDRMSTMPTAVKKLNVPSENWLLVDGKAVRPADRQGARRQSPCLISSTSHGAPRLGVMMGLQSIPGDALAARLTWYDERVEAGRLARSAAQGRQSSVIPIFLLHDGATCTLIVPSIAGLRLDKALVLRGTSLSQVVPTEVLERGVDFVRYAITKQ